MYFVPYLGDVLIETSDCLLVCVLAYFEYTTGVVISTTTAGNATPRNPTHASDAIKAKKKSRAVKPALLNKHRTFKFCYN